jgi:uncharacterized membrane protein YfcA
MLLLAGASFTSAFISACFSVGGGYVLFGATTWMLPLQSAIALQSVLSFGSLFSRTHAFWAEIEWSIVRSFTTGSLVGVTGGLWAFRHVPSSALAILLAALLWLLAWMPNFRVRMSSGQSFFAVGILHAVVGTLFGLGAILQPALLRTALSRTAIVGTFATCIIALELLRTSGYAAGGFPYGQYWPEIAVATLTGFGGTYLGKRVPPPISDATFRRAMRIFVTLLGASILYRGVAPWIRSTA